MPSSPAASGTESTNRSGRSTSATSVFKNVASNNWRSNRPFATRRHDHALRDSRSPSRSGSRSGLPSEKNAGRERVPIPGSPKFAPSVHRHPQREPQRRSEREPQRLDVERCISDISSRSALTRTLAKLCGPGQGPPTAGMAGARPPTSGWSFLYWNTRYLATNLAGTWDELSTWPSTWPPTWPATWPGPWPGPWPPTRPWPPAWPAARAGRQLGRTEAGRRAAPGTSRLVGARSPMRAPSRSSAPCPARRLAATEGRPVARDPPLAGVAARARCQEGGKVDP